MITAKTAELPLRAAARLIRLPAGIQPQQLAELRLRSGRPAVAVTVTGGLYRCSDVLTREDIEACFQEICRCSVHSYSREIAEGWITLDGGHRAGFCGTAVMQRDRLETVRDISSINLRLAHEVRGCAEELYNAVFSRGVRSLLIAGRPMSGKTTVLRDLARILGESHRVALIDSRCELAAVYNGTPTLDVGLNTDVLDGYPRAEGMMTALRTLSPEIIICDEIGNDHNAVSRCLSCGVAVIATIHAGSVAELMQDAQTAALLPLFGCAAVLDTKGRLKSIKEFRSSQERR